MSPLAILASLEVAHDGCPSSLARGRVEIREVAPGVAFARAPTFDEIRPFLRGPRASERVEEEAGHCTALVEGLCASRSGAEGLAPDCWILYPICARDGLERLDVLAVSREALEAGLHALRRHARVKVGRVRAIRVGTLERTLATGDLLKRMSRRQFQALTLALHTGYFEAPRRRSAAELAHALGIARSTFTEHLQKAQSALMLHVASLLEARPDLAQQARKGPGRPRAAASRMDPWDAPALPGTIIRK